MTVRRNDSPEAVIAFLPEYKPTPLPGLPRLADHCGVARILLKDEGPLPEPDIAERALS